MRILERSTPWLTCEPLGANRLLKEPAISDAGPHRGFRGIPRYLRGSARRQHDLEHSEVKLTLGETDKGLNVKEGGFRSGR